MSKPKHPNQPLIKDKHRTVRFKRNRIVEYLLNVCTAEGIADMNKLAVIDFPREDRVQFAQLIGYSLRGFGELNYVTNKDYKSAEQQ